MAAGLHEMFFNFLYPVQTHALIRRLDRATRSHLQAAKLAQQSSRKYTSLAEDLLAGKTGSGRCEQQQESEVSGDLEAKEKVQAMQGIAEALLERLTGPEDYDELWKLQQEAFEVSQPFEAGVLNRIFYSLSTSQRSIDHERSLALFETIDQKTSMLYSTAVKTALRLKDVDIAIDIHGEAAARTPGTIDIGTPDILKYAIEQNQWRLAIETWYRLWHSKFVYYSVQRDLWKEVDSLSLHDMLYQTEKAVDFASSMITSASSMGGDGPHQATAIVARDFALTMAEKAFGARGVVFITSQYVSLLEKVKALNITGAKFYLQALGQILSLEDQGNLAAAINIYSELRRETLFAPSQDLLEQMLTLFKTLENPSGLLMVLEDWQSYLPTRLPVVDYISIGRILADKGSDDEMEILVNSFFDQYKPMEVSKELETRLLNSALFLHFRRVDTRKIVQCFDNFRRQRNSIPDMMSYHYIIMTFSAVEDVENTLSWFKKLKDSGFSLRRHSFYGPIRMFAKRGDIDALNVLLEEMDQKRLKPGISIMVALVTANLKNDRYEEAANVVMKALKMKLRGSQTILWNILLNAHAQRGDLGKVSALHQQMYTAGVPENSSTYAAVLIALCLSGSVTEARHVMMNVMPRLGIERTIFHYAAIMKGYLDIGNYAMVFYTYKHLLADDFVPNSNIHAILLSAAASSDKKEKKHDVEKKEFPRAHAVFDTTLKHWDRIEFASRAPRNESARGRIREASFSAPYQYMIYLYGSEASFAKVTDLYNDYVAKGKLFGLEDLEANPSILMLTDLLRVHEMAGNDEDVERYWYLVLDKLEKSSSRSNANLAEPGWVVYAHRYFTDFPLRAYLKHLFDRHRFQDMISVIRDVRWAGYELSNASWNYYVQYLSASPDASHRYLAFEVCEKELMQDWPGWTRLATNNDNIVRDWQFMNKAMRRESRATRSMTEKRMVDYRTIVQLAGVHKEGSSGVFGVSSDEVMRDELARLAPITVGAIQTLPRIADKEQMTFLYDTYN